MRVAVLGGAGVFGSRLAELLIRDGHEVTLAGRDPGRTRAAAARLGAGAVAVDRDGDLAPLFAGRPEAVVDASGPFQGYGPDPYRVARACLRHGADYLDLADDAAFAAGIAALDAEARGAGRRLLSGVSSVPALSSAAVAHLAGGLESVALIDTAILPGNRAPRGVSVVAAIAGQAGAPLRLWRGGGWRDARGWTEGRRIPLAPGLARRGFLIGVPDLALFPAAFGARSVVFRAGLELGLLNHGLRALAALRRRWPVAVTPRRAARLARAAGWLEPLGTDRGGMRVAVTGARGGEAVERTWTLVAEAGDGPFVPGVPARALLRRLGQVPPGARPALAEAPLADFEAAMADLAVATAVAEAPRPPLFRAILGAAWAELPPALRDLHDVQDLEVFAGTAEVTRGTSPLGRLVAALFGFPPAAAVVPVVVTKTRRPRGETWVRDFDGRRFRSHLAAGDGPGLLRERFGPLRFEMALGVRDGGIDWPVRRGWCLGVPLPRALLPRVTAREEVADGAFRFDVAIALPLAGPVVRYRGTLGRDAAGRDARPG